MTVEKEDQSCQHHETSKLATCPLSEQHNRVGLIHLKKISNHSILVYERIFQGALRISVGGGVAAPGSEVPVSFGLFRPGSALDSGRVRTLLLGSGSETPKIGAFQGEN